MTVTLSDNIPNNPRSPLCLVDKNLSLSLKARIMSLIRDLMVDSLIDVPLFKRKRERLDRPITAEHQIEQSIIAMGDQFQLNYIHSLLLVPSVVLNLAAVKVLLIF